MVAMSSKKEETAPLVFCYYIIIVNFKKTRKGLVLSCENH